MTAAPDAAIDLERALLDPASVFASPEAVLDHPRLDRSQKVEILRRWRYDLSELSVAEEEGMGGGESADMLRRVLQALRALTAGDDEKGVSPTKQHN